MDISAFSKDNFVAKKWINDIFKQTHHTPADNEVFLQSLVNKLQLHVEEVNSVIEENCQKTASNLPKVISETQVLNQNVLFLAEKLSTIKHEIENIEKNTDDSVSNLEKIDRLKTILENVKQALHEADNWSILASDIEECFDRGNAEKVTSILISMQQSLNVLSNADDYEDKKMQLEGLKNRLEASVSPHIVKAFTTYSFDEAVKFVKMFRDIERLPQLLKYYIKCQKGSLCQHWKSIVDSDQDLNLVEQLRSLYDMLLVNWQKQIRWCDEVFVSINMVDMMIELYAEILIDLDPSLMSCMDTSLKQHAQPLLLLLEYHQSSCQFQQNLESLYVFNNDSGRSPDWKPILKSIYHPYVPYASKYGTLERQLLDSYLWDSLSKLDDSQTDLIDCIRSVGLTIPRIMTVAKEAENRCMQFTHGCALDGLITALKGYFLKYIDKYKEICERLSKQVDNKENWHVLTSCLSFQQIIGELLNEIRKFESHLCQIIKNMKNDYETDNYVSLILNSAAQKDFENLLKSVTSESTPPLLQNVIGVLEKLAYEVHHITYRILFQPISFHLNNVREILGKLNADTRDLPDYSYSPLEYITQIGEHLITLPQHLEPFLSQDNFALNSVLEIIKKETESIPTEKGTYANVLLMLAAHGTCQAYSDQILNIRELNTSSVRQLSADINYLGNVLEELGIGLADNLQHILQLLRLSSDEYQAKSVGYPPKLVAAIRQIRKLLST